MHLQFKIKDIVVRNKSNDMPLATVYFHKFNRIVRCESIIVAFLFLSKCRGI